MSLCINRPTRFSSVPFTFGSPFDAISLFPAAARETGTSGEGNLKSRVNFNSIYIPTLAPKRRREKNQWWEKLLFASFRVTNYITFDISLDCSRFQLRYSPSPSFFFIQSSVHNILVAVFSFFFAS